MNIHSHNFIWFWFSFFFPEKDMRFRPKGWPLPRPKIIHHVIENFFTEWHAPKTHIQPLRRFLEHCMQTDLRAFYAGKMSIADKITKEEHPVIQYKLIQLV